MDCYRAPMRAIIALATLLTASVNAAPADAGETAGQAGIKGDGGTVRLLVNPFGTNSFPPFVIQKFEPRQEIRLHLAGHIRGHHPGTDNGDSGP